VKTGIKSTILEQSGIQLDKRVLDAAEADRLKRL
jgi:hypothetical protein